MRIELAAAALAVLSAVPIPGRAEPAPSAPAAASAAGGSPPGAPAQGDAERKKLEEEIARELGTASPSLAARPPAPAPAAPVATSAPLGAGGSPYARVLLLPDISAIGSAGAAYDSYDVGAYSPRESPYSPKDRPDFFLEEVELGLQAVVDPYARADFFLSFGPDGAKVEEGYLTTLSLPDGLQIKAGQIFSPFGRQNQQHPHIWDFVDAPLARNRLLASDQLAGPGVDVAWLMPLPWFAELHLAGQDTAPFTGDTNELTGLARLVQFFTLGDATSLGVGLSAARRHEGPNGAARDLGGADVYLRIRPLNTRSYLAVQGEVYLRKLRGVEGEDPSTEHAWWTQAFWRQDAYWGYGVRYEQAPSAGSAPPGTEQRLGGVATWFPSEFQRLRLQLSWDRLPGGKGGLEALLHLEFGIGAHGAHPF
ncbi:MAG TPA: hypothetical protein VML50_08405 [Anaeromyxobacter sp.]|nr:hypothetical protein [Anaeromyxobacter sp.]